MKGILIDLDGAVFEGDKLIEGADVFIKELQDKAFPHLFLTNSSAKPRSAIVKKLASLGIEVKPQEILTPAVACAQWLCEQGIERLSLLLPRETAEDLVGFEVLSLNGSEIPQAIVVGDLGERWNFSRLNQAFRLLIDEPHPTLVALGMTRYWSEKESLSLDVGPFVKALEYASNCKVEVIGKPSPTFFDEGLHILGLEAPDCAMVGDDIVADIKGSQEAGLKSILVKTGKFRERDLNSGITPDHVINSIVDLRSILQF